MNRVRSKDGAAIAWERSGNGPALIVVDGALCSVACKHCFQRHRFAPVCGEFPRQLAVAEPRQRIRYRERVSFPLLLGWASLQEFVGG